MGSVVTTVSISLFKGMSTALIIQTLAKGPIILTNGTKKFAAVAATVEAAQAAAGGTTVSGKGLSQ